MKQGGTLSSRGTFLFYIYYKEESQKKKRQEKAKKAGSPSWGKRPVPGEPDRQQTLVPELTMTWGRGGGM